MGIQKEGSPQLATLELSFLGPRGAAMAKDTRGSPSPWRAYGLAGVLVGEGALES